MYGCIAYRQYVRQTHRRRPQAPGAPAVCDIPLGYVVFESVSAGTSTHCRHTMAVPFKAGFTLNGVNPVLFIPGWPPFGAAAASAFCFGHAPHNIQTCRMLRLPVRHTIPRMRHRTSTLSFSGTDTAALPGHATVGHTRVKVQVCVTPRFCEVTGTNQVGWKLNLSVIFKKSKCYRFVPFFRQNIAAPGAENRKTLQPDLDVRRHNTKKKTKSAFPRVDSSWCSAAYTRVQGGAGGYRVRDTALGT